VTLKQSQNSTAELVIYHHQFNTLQLTADTFKHSCSILRFLGYLRTLAPNGHLPDMMQKAKISLKIHNSQKDVTGYWACTKMRMA